MALLVIGDGLSLVLVNCFDRELLTMLCCVPAGITTAEPSTLWVSMPISSPGGINVSSIEVSMKGSLKTAEMWEGIEIKKLLAIKCQINSIQSYKSY
jgi:hypothetical protein